MFVVIGDYKMNFICENFVGFCFLCEVEYFSCIGKRDGFQVVFGRKNFFMECMDEWIKRVIECFVVVFNFDLVFGLCVMEFDLCKYLVMF